MKISHISMIAGLTLYSLSFFSYAESASPSLVEDCFNEWSSRGWVLGEDRTLASNIAVFKSGIKRVCALRAKLFMSGENISPYIQASMPEIAPYLYSAADEQSLITFIKRIEDRGDTPSFSGTFMRD